jgi:predicted membrane protein
MQNVGWVVLGAIMLVLGRKLFWLFVGLIGFAVGLQASQFYFGLQPYWVLWTIGLIAGVIGALLALFFQHVAIVLGGFAAGATLALHLSVMLGQNAGALVAFIGGIVGAVALYLLFDWALIALSSLIGATFIIQALGWRSMFAPALILIILVAVGVMIQTRLLLASRKGGG